MPGRALSQQLLSIRLTNIDKLKGFKALDENILLTGRALSQQVFLIRLMKIDNLKKHKAMNENFQRESRSPSIKSSFCESGQRVINRKRKFLYARGWIKQNKKGE